MGQLRSSYRYVSPALTDAGFTVAAMDLRGHGDSDAKFDRYDDAAAGEDLLALVDHLGGPAVLVGSSLTEHRRRIAARLRRPGHRKAFTATTRTSHQPAEARLAEVAAPILVVMGEADPDFGDPAAEAWWIADQLEAEVVLVPGGGALPARGVPQRG